MAKIEKFPENSEFSKRDYVKWIALVLFIGLIVFVFLSEKVLFSDVPQYLGVGKEFAEISHAKVRNTPGWIYGWFLGKILSISPSITAVKILNLIWFSLSLLILYLIVRRYEVLLLYLASPLVWYLAPWTNPLHFISLLFLITYYLFYKDKFLFYLIGSLLLGLATAIWWPAFYFSVFFFLSFMYDKRFYNVLLNLIAFLITFSIRIIFDWYYFSMPFFSTLRGLGSNLAFLVGEAPDGLPEHSILKYFMILVIMTPLIYRLAFVNWVKERKTGIFLILCLVLFLFNFQFRFFMSIMPIVVLLIGSKVSKKELIFGLVVSIVVVLFLTSGYFSSRDKLITDDLKEIEKDFYNERFIVGYEGGSEEEAAYLDTLYFGDKIKEFIRYSEYKLWLKNDNLFREYKFESKSKINDLRKLQLNLKYLVNGDNDFKDVKYWILIKDGNADSDFKLVKEYKVLKVFKKS